MVLEHQARTRADRPFLQHPAVAEAAVVGVPGEALEDEVKACIVLRHGHTLTPEALIDWCELRLPYFAVPRYVEFLQELPKTPSEKIQKNVLRAAGVSARTWDREKAGYRLRERPLRMFER